MAPIIWEPEWTEALYSMMEQTVTSSDLSGYDSYCLALARLWALRNFYSHWRETVSMQHYPVVYNTPFGQARFEP